MLAHAEPGLCDVAYVIIPFLQGDCFTTGEWQNKDLNLGLSGSCCFLVSGP